VHFRAGVATVFDDFSSERHFGVLGAAMTAFSITVISAVLLASEHGWRSLCAPPCPML
jgi:hypothetical protein